MGRSARKRAGRIAGTILAATLSSCSNKPLTKSASADDQAPTESSSVSPSLSPSPSSNGADATRQIHAYFAAMASTNPDSLRRAVRKTTVPGSLAAAYGIHQAGGTDADIDGGSEVVRETMKTLGEGDVQLCVPSANDDGSDACYRYGNFKVNQQGRIAHASAHRV